MFKNDTEMNELSLALSLCLSATVENASIICFLR